jgi:cytochrome c peroxidase
MKDIKKKSGVLLLVMASSLIVSTGLCPAPASAAHPHQWSEDETATLRSLWIGSLSSPPPNPSNAFADNPRAAALGRKFFFDTRLSGNDRVSCGTCHRPDYAFTDNLPLAHGMGTTSRRTMPLLGMSYQTWFFWDGRKDSLWSQALGPIESPVEHGFTRTMCFAVINEHYRAEYEEAFGPLPEVADKKPLARPATDDPVALKAWISMPEETRERINNVYADMGKAIAAYVRTILPGPSRFDEYVEAVLKGDDSAMKRTFTSEEAMGLKLFIGKAKCTNCHNGPMLSNGDFHNVGVPDAGGRRDRGRAAGIIQVLADEFNCLSGYSDAEPRQCTELRFIDTAQDKYAGAFKTPTLRNVAERPPYMHAGQFNSLMEVLKFYRKAAKERVHAADIEHADLTDRELGQIEAFLKTLSGPIKALGERE